MRASDQNRKERVLIAGLVLAGYGLRRYLSANYDPRRAQDDPDHPGYGGWYWTRPGSAIQIGAFKTRREALADITERELGR